MDYKRLTERKGEDIAIDLNACEITDIKDFTHAKLIKKVATRLAEFEDKIENGTLVALPCKVGDIVYQLDNGGEIYELMILTITIHTNKFYYETLGIDFDNRAIGETIFLTKSEAEAKLRELQGDRE